MSINYQAGQIQEPDNMTTDELLYQTKTKQIELQCHYVQDKLEQILIFKDKHELVNVLNRVLSDNAADYVCI